MGRRRPSEPFRRPFSTAASRGALAQLSGISVKSAADAQVVRVRVIASVSTTAKILLLRVFMFTYLLS